MNHQANSLLYTKGNNPKQLKLPHNSLLREMNKHKNSTNHNKVTLPIKSFLNLLQITPLWEEILRLKKIKNSIKVSSWQKFKSSWRGKKHSYNLNVWQTLSWKIPKTKEVHKIKVVWDNQMTISESRDFLFNKKWTKIYTNQW